MKRTNTQKLVECALMVAIASVLSMFKLMDMPYGGSITLASMLPVVLISYRWGILWGLGSGAVYAVVEQLFGLHNLFYFTDWKSVVAIILLDYVVAFLVIGLGGMYRRVIKSQALGITLGAFTVALLRYVSHVISGCTVWAGLSIPTEAAFVYSLVYNATYMIPETIVLCLGAYYLGSLIDFTTPMPTRIATAAENKQGDGLFAGAGATALVGIISLVVFLFGNLQNGETGEFDIQALTSLSFMDWIPTLVIVTICACATAGFLWARKKQLNKYALDKNS